ncbi:MAG: hypothetical protein AMJ38_02260 [Dehalococcoidia bacterium DG_22]|nr:MAG: hypothetical protein AMJ38_02260 [Dehalococcoidia bacterium DG_22]
MDAEQAQKGLMELLTDDDKLALRLLQLGRRRQAMGREAMEKADLGCGEGRGNHGRQASIPDEQGDLAPARRAQPGDGGAEAASGGVHHRSLAMEAQRQLQEAYITVARLRQALRKAAGKIEGLDEGTSSPSQCRKEV